MAPLLHSSAIKKLQGKNIMAPLLHRAAIKKKKEDRNHRAKI